MKSNFDYLGLMYMVISSKGHYAESNLANDGEISTSNRQSETIFFKTIIFSFQLIYTEQYFIKIISLHILCDASAMQSCAQLNQGLICLSLALPNGCLSWSMASYNI